MYSLLACIIVSLGIWGIYIPDRDKKLGYPISFGRVGMTIWWVASFFLAVIIGGLVAGMADEQPPSSIWSVCLVGPVVLRLRDLGWSLWWAVLGITPLLPIFALALCLIPGTKRKLMSKQNEGRFEPEPELEARFSMPPLPPKPSIGSIWLTQNTQVSGPYDAPSLLAIWDNGQIAGNSLYWHDQISDWKPLARDIEVIRQMFHDKQL